MHLRPELLGTEEHQTEVTPTLGDVEEHLADISVRPVAWCVLVELIDEDDEVFYTEVAALEMLAEP